MQRVHRFIAAISQEIAARSARLGARVEINADVLDRSDSIDLAAPGMRSANASARMVRASDGWIAVNLPRADDLESVPALLQTAPAGDAWSLLEREAPQHACAELVARAELLGLAIAGVGETTTLETPCRFRRVGARRRSAPLYVIDVSALWAGPLCGAVFAAMGADVLKLDTYERPDPTPHAAPALDRRLNSAKRQRRVALAELGATLAHDIAAADILITSARARALANLGLTRNALFEANPNLIWVAVTGHGYASPRIAFGDDAAASGGLTAWRENAPRFIGDALADPIAGLVAAAAALAALERQEAGFIDAALASAAAYVAQGAP